jgi:HlyD family secretion protein
MNFRRTPQLILAVIMAATVAACVTEEQDTMVGTLERDRYELKVEQSEPIISIHVADGQQVSAGQLVLSQDASRQQASLDRQIALRDQAAARLAELRRGPRQESIREAQARLQASQAREVNAAANLVRVQSMFERDLSKQSDLDTANTLARTTSAEVLANKETLTALLNGTTVEELQQAEAQLASMEAAVRQAQINLERLEIQAPVDGMIDKVLYETGERPPVGSTIAVLLGSDRSYARIYVPEHLRARVQTGDELEVLIDGTGETLQGVVSWVSADASFTPYFALTEHDRSRLSYLAEVDVPGASSLPSGLPLEARIPVSGD